MTLLEPVSFLIIDDDEDDRELFQMALDQLDFKTNFYGVDSGITALELLKKRVVKPDYIFLDLNMPQMSGRECLQKIKSESDLSRIPVVIFSTSSDPRDKKETKEIGAIDFITKPPKTSELTLILNKFILTQTQNVNQS